MSEHSHICSAHAGGAFACTCPVGHIKKLPCRGTCSEWLCATNAKLLAALKALMQPCPPGTHIIGPDGECPECDVERQALAAITEAEGKA